MSSVDVGDRAAAGTLGGEGRSPFRDAVVTLKHGAGGVAMRRLIETLFVPDMPDIGHHQIGLRQLDDGAALRVGCEWLVFTTDSHVVHPIFFPGGDIGRLAVTGTVNDLAVMGATVPLALALGVVVEEGFPMVDLARIQDSIRAACLESGAPVVTGDTKVMGRGEMDGIVLSTTGVALTRTVVTDAGLREGDRIVVSGTIGDHGIALMALRHGLDLGGGLRSDVAPINGLLHRALSVAPGAVHAMKDPTRGGLSGALHEMAAKSGVEILIDEPEVPVSEPVRSAAEILGLDPFHIANEGKVVIGVAADAVTEVLDALRGHPLGAAAAAIGICRSGTPGRVVLDTGLGRRLLPEIEGEPLPRIC